MAIETEDQFRAWLEEQSREVCVAIAWRAAMRVLPLTAYGDVNKFGFSGDKLNLLAGLRLCITTIVTLHNPNKQLLKAAIQADEQIMSAASPEDQALFSAVWALSAAISTERHDLVRSVVSALDNAAGAAMGPYAGAEDDFDAFDRIFSASFEDTSFSVKQITQGAIATLGEFESRAQKHHEGPTNLLYSGGGDPFSWSFWVDWYSRAMLGDPLPWDLQENIALIPDEIWEAGPEAVAEEIDKLRFENATSTAPRLVRDEEDEVFRVEADPVPLGDLAEFAAGRAEQALAAALAGVSPNIFNEGSYEAVVIRGVLEGPRTTSLLATGLYDACLGLHANIGDRYPEEVALLNLKNGLAGIVDELCEADGVARERCAKLAGYAPPPIEDALSEADLRLIPEITAPDLDQEARDIIESDVERALAEIARQEAMPRWRRIRLANWMTTISIYWDRTKKGFKEAETLAKMVSKLRAAWRAFGGGE